MKNTILMALLGLTVAVITPSIAVADSNDKKWRSNNSDVRSHVKRNRHWVKPRRSHNNTNRRHDRVVKHFANRYNNNRRYNKPNNTFSITFGNGQPEITFGNNHPERYSYNNNRRNNKWRIKQRINTQSRRIQKGIDRGQLVRREARTLRKEQNRISWKFSKFKRDGRLDRRERSKLNRMLDVAGNNITRLKRNQVTRNSRHYNYNNNYVRR